VFDVTSLPEIGKNECFDNVKSDIYYEQGHLGRIVDFLVEEKFEELEEMVVKLRKEKTIAPNGRFHLSWFYRYLSKNWGNIVPSQKEWITEKLDKWILQYPKSVTPRIIKANIYIRIGWKARGTGWAKDVTEEGWKVFREELNTAWEILEKAEKLEQKDPELYRCMLSIAMGTSKPDEVAKDLFEKGVALEPRYYRLYSVRAVSLLPRWGGRWEDAGRFAQRAVELTKETDGESFYFRIALSLLNYGDKDDHSPFLNHGFSYERLKRAYKDFGDLYPNLNFQRNSFALIACVYDDKETAREILDELGKNIDYLAWDGSRNYKKYRKWVYGDKK
jgi:hypothetical protein